MLVTLLADAPVVQVGWDGLLAMGGGIGAGLTAAARIVVNYLTARDANEKDRREEERAERTEARLENRNQNNAILGIQKATVESLAEMQREIGRLADRIDSGSKERPAHQPRDRPPPRAQQ